MLSEDSRLGAMAVLHFFCFPFGHAIEKGETGGIPSGEESRPIGQKAASAFGSATNR
jgi:hypothetical protein